MQPTCLVYWTVLKVISTETQIFTLYILLIAVVMERTGAQCSDPAYLVQLKNEVRSFYTFGNGHHCVPENGSEIGRPRWPVYIQQREFSEKSTCPWIEHITAHNDSNYPSRIATAFLPDGTNPHNITRTCLSGPRSNHLRIHNKICKQLFQKVPIVERTGCRNGTNDYAITHTRITVGFTCTFVDNDGD